MWRVFNQIDNIALAKSQESADWSWTGATVVAAAFFPGGVGGFFFLFFPTV